MTMYRRFCCNDLLRLGQLSLQPKHKTHDMFIYMTHLGMWPGNCLVAYFPGGQISGYILGSIEGTGEDCNGWMTMLSGFLDLKLELRNMLEDSCDMIYNAYTIKFLTPANDIDTILKGKKAGYEVNRYHYHDGTLSEEVEMMKPLSRLIARRASEVEEED